MGIVEEAEGVQNIRDILRQVRGIGAIWAGPWDMSVSMGLRGQASHPAVQENLLHVWPLAKSSAFHVRREPRLMTWRCASSKAFGLS
jgi:2-keto-3-deoxy-L-rhamnonate aldolase RhmA